jgi:hypothetical protein
MLEMTVPRVYMVGFGSSIPGRGGGDWEFFSSPLYPDWLWGPPTLLSNRYLGLLPQGYSSQGVRLTTHLLLELRSRIHGTMPPPYNVFMVWCLIKHRDNFTFYCNTVNDAVCLSLKHALCLNINTHLTLFNNNHRV